MLRIIVAVGLLVLVGCEPSECKQMKQCCEQLAGEPWVGQACGSITEGVDGAKACGAVTEAIRIAAEDGDKQIPAVCQ